MNDEFAVQQKNEPAANATNLQELKEQIQTLTVLNNSYLKEIRAFKQQNEYLNFQIRSSRNYTAKNIQPYGISQSREHYALRIGNIIIDAVRKPGKNTIMMPIRMVRVMFEIIAKRKPVKSS